MINKKSLNHLKKIIYYEEISKLIPSSIKTFKLNQTEKNSAINKIKSEKNGYYINQISNNKKEIMKFFANNAYREIDYKEVDLNNNNIYFYPTNFEIISEDAYMSLLKIIEIENSEKELIFIIIMEKYI